MDDDRTHPRPAGEAADDGAGQPLDDVDATILVRLRETYDSADPVPVDLVDRIRFSLALEELHDEVARMTRLPVDELATRSDPVNATRTETLTFSADRLTAMVTVSRVGPGTVRLDGWIAPAEPCRVRLRMQGGGEHEVVADEQGRFSFAELPDGFGQLGFYPGAADAGAEGDDSSVVTPLFQL